MSAAISVVAGLQLFERDHVACASILARGPDPIDCTGDCLDLSGRMGNLVLIPLLCFIFALHIESVARVAPREP